MNKKLDTLNELDPAGNVTDRVRHYFFCPGCKSPHAVYSKGTGVPNWGYNGDEIEPSFTPSIRVQWGDENGPQLCHSYVTNGWIQFLNDCTHELKGQHVKLPDWE